MFTRFTSFLLGAVIESPAARAVEARWWRFGTEGLSSAGEAISRQAADPGFEGEHGACQRLGRELGRR